MNKSISIFLLLTILLVISGCRPKEEKINFANNQYELNSGWLCKNIKDVKSTGEELSRTSDSLINWMPATVPGTVLTTLLNNKLVPNPFYGMNNKKIPDIYDAGREYYTYWFVKNFQ